VLVREGLARVSGSKGMSRLAELEALEAEARSHRRGLWAAERQ
jgi:endonuclease YncB( thermonuclease family)